MEAQQSSNIVKKKLAHKIFSGEYPIDSHRPGERTLAKELGTNRTVLRQVLYNLESAGVLEVQQGKPTLVKNYWESGRFSLLHSLLHYTAQLPDDFFEYILHLRFILAPQYSRLAAHHDPKGVTAVFKALLSTPDDQYLMVEADWEAHQALVHLSRNPLFLMINNEFSILPQQISFKYFENPQIREDTRYFYTTLADLSQKNIDQMIDFLEFGLARAIVNWRRSNKQLDYDQALQEVIALIPTLEPILERKFY